MFTDLEFVKTTLNAITAKFRSVKSDVDAVQANVDAVKSDVDAIRVIQTGGGLPSGGTPYQELVTDGNGNTKWEDRLAYYYSRLVIDVETVQYVKVSDEVPSWASVDVPMKFWMSNGNIHTATHEQYIDFGNGSFLAGDFVFFITTDNFEIFSGENSLVFPEKGVYFAKLSNNYISGIASADSDTPEITWDGSLGGVKKLDEKFLPDPLILYVQNEK